MAGDKTDFWGQQRPCGPPTRQGHSGFDDDKSVKLSFKRRTNVEKEVFKTNTNAFTLHVLKTYIEFASVVFLPRVIVVRRNLEPAGQTRTSSQRRTETSLEWLLGGQSQRNVQLEQFCLVIVFLSLNTKIIEALASVSCRGDSANCRVGPSEPVEDDDFASHSWPSHRHPAVEKLCDKSSFATAETDEDKAVLRRCPRKSSINTVAKLLDFGLVLHIYVHQNFRPPFVTPSHAVDVRARGRSQELKPGIPHGR